VSIFRLADTAVAMWLLLCGSVLLVGSVAAGCFEKLETDDPDYTGDPLGR
jgi:hypothetical protein